MLKSNFRGLLLGGDLVNIGNSQDAFCDYSSERTIKFTLTAKEKTSVLEFDRANDKNFLPLVNNHEIVSFEELNLFDSNFQYIAAEHLV